MSRAGRGIPECWKCQYLGLGWNKNSLLGKFEKAAICLRLGLPSTLIRHQKRLFKAGDFETTGFVF